MHFYTQNSMRTALTSHPGRRTNSSVPILSSCWVGQWKEDLPFLTYHTGTDPRSFINAYLLLLQLLHEPEGRALFYRWAAVGRGSLLFSARELLGPPATVKLQQVQKSNIPKLHQTAILQVPFLKYIFFFLQ